MTGLSILLFFSRTRKRTPKGGRTSGMWVELFRDSGNIWIWLIQSIGVLGAVGSIVIVAVLK